jgi:2-polyprenyl-6-methoxyphenol hydroxylase-like FAD-dependent oxidoreductase
MSTSIVVAGGGPVGLMLACELGLAGVDTILVERLCEQSGRSRGMAINSAVVELLTQRGLMHELRGDGLEWPQAHFAHLMLDPTRVRERHAYNFLLPQSQLERRLEERANKLGVDIRRGHNVVGVAHDDSGVTLTVRSSAGEQPIRCSYLVGCDGADSTVRRLIGIGFPGSDAPFRGITGDLAVEWGDELFQHIGIFEYPNGIFTLAPSGPRLLRITTGEFDVEPESPEAPVTVEELRACVARVAGIELTTGEPCWLERWTNATRQAERYRAGRVFLAGDAAHIHFPFGGQALSTGIEDSVNLGWKLAAQINGWAPQGLLDTYHLERHPVGARACLTTQAQQALLHPLEQVAPLRAVINDLIDLYEVNEYLVRMVTGLDVRYQIKYPALEGGAEGHPLLGRRLADIPLSTPTGESSVAQFLAKGRGLLLDFTEDAGCPGEFSGWTDRLDIVAAEPAPEIDADVALLRPDGRVAWAGRGKNAKAGLRAALKEWFGAPADCPHDEAN